MTGKDLPITWRNSPWTVVVTGVMVFAAGAVILFSSWHRTHQHVRIPAQACHNNLQQIEIAKKLWAEDEEKGSNAAPTGTDLSGTNNYLKGVLTCPSGGTYTIGRIREKPRCSIPGHTI